MSTEWTESAFVRLMFDRTRTHILLVNGRLNETGEHRLRRLEAAIKYLWARRRRVIGDEE